MNRKYRVITLCGSTKFRNDFEDMTKKLTLDGNIVISVGLFGHSGDAEVWEGKDEGYLSQTKQMLDDMHKSKIDMADSIFVINPNGYIGRSTWSEICYAKMTDKPIEFMEPVPQWTIDEMVDKHIAEAEEEARHQLDGAQHHGAYFNFANSTTIAYKKMEILDPWIREDAQGVAWVWEEHKNPNYGVDPFRYYGKNKTARFIEEILSRRGEL